MRLLAHPQAAIQQLILNERMKNKDLTLGSKAAQKKNESRRLEQENGGQKGEKEMDSVFVGGSSSCCIQVQPVAAGGSISAANVWQIHSHKVKMKSCGGNLHGNSLLLCPDLDQCPDAMAGTEKRHFTSSSGRWSHVHPHVIHYCGQGGEPRSRGINICHCHFISCHFLGLFSSLFFFSEC